MEVKKRLLVYFNRETTVEEFVDIFDGVLSPRGWNEDRDDNIFPRKSIEEIGKQFVRKSSDTVAISVLEDRSLKWESFCSLGFYQKSEAYAGWNVITVDDFITKYRPELKQKFYFEDELMNLLCPLGGDETNDCADCAYAGDYHFVDGKCVRRDD